MNNLKNSSSLFNVLAGSPKLKIFNQAKGICISQNTKEAASLSDKLLGMLKQSNLGGLVLNTRFGIHTFFLKKPIDVIVLDNDFNVVKAGTVKPNSLFFWNPKYSLILELPQGTIKKTKTETGNHLKILS